nr:hypothetical protein L203_04664 [Cryptococcus depauperatus CBS 7841]
MPLAETNNRSLYSAFVKVQQEIIKSLTELTSFELDQHNFPRQLVQFPDSELKDARNRLEVAMSAHMKNWWVNMSIDRLIGIKSKHHCMPKTAEKAISSKHRQAIYDSISDLTNVDPQA